MQQIIINNSICECSSPAIGDTVSVAIVATPRVELRRAGSMSEQRGVLSTAEPAAAPKTFLQKLLDGVETVGNKVPHPAVIFFILSGLVIVLSHLFYLLGTSVNYEVVNPQTHQVEHATATVESLLSGDGIRFMLTSMVRNFTNFGPVGIIIVVMIGVGLAEQAGLMTALIKKIVQVTPRKAVTWSLVTVGGAGEHCCRCRVPGPDSARSRRVFEPWTTSARRVGGGVRRGCRGIRRQFSDRAD
jgi:hypothetical protein